MPHLNRWSCVTLFMIVTYPFHLTGQGYSWSDLTPSGTGPILNSNLAVYDPGSNRLIIFGGINPDGSCCTNATWVLTDANGTGGSSTWIELAPAGPLPPPRVSHSATYDSSNNRLIIFGGGQLNCGSFCAPMFNDVWILSNANGIGGAPVWTELAPIGPPPAGRTGHRAVYDPTSNRMVTFGGGNDGLADMNDTWVLTNANGLGSETSQWIQLSPTGTLPSPREVYMVGYDQSANTMTVFGGVSDDVFEGDLWILSKANGVSGTPKWQEITQSQPAPGTLANWNYGYDQGTAALIFFGGSPTFGNYSNAVWELSNANGLAAPTWRQLIPNGAAGSPPIGASIGTWDPNLKTLMIVPDAQDVWFLNGLAGYGLDLSQQITDQTGFWTQAKNMGIRFAAVAAWGGGPSPYPWAEANLLGAQQNNVGTAAYAVLNYFEDQTGTYQIDQAIQAIGTAKGALRFIAVDVEYCCGEFVYWKASHHYKTLLQTGRSDLSSITDPAYHIQTVVTAGTSGATQPLWNDSGGQTQDGTVVWQDSGHVVIADAASRVQWITDAVNEILANGLSPVIYTTRGFWSFYAGKCDANPKNTNPCPNLIQLPLWDSEKPCGDGIIGLSPFTAFPTKKYGWQTRSGNQYMVSNSGCPQTVIDKITVDLDYFDPILFQ